MQLTKDNVKVEWVDLGEGFIGDYDSNDPEDIEFLRYDVYVLIDDEWIIKDDGSYCTQFPTNTTQEQKLAGLQLLLNKFHSALSSDIEIPIKRLGEYMSSISPETMNQL